MSQKMKKSLKLEPETLALIWMQTVWHSDSAPERSFWKSSIWKKASRQQYKNEKLPSSKAGTSAYQNADT